MQEYLEVGKIINKRGLRGEVKVECYCDDVGVLCALETVFLDKRGERAVRVLSAKPYKGYVYLMLSGVNSCDAADALRGKSLYARREDIPLEEGKNFIVELIGLPVIDVDSGVVYGELTDVFNRGASDIYTVEKDGKEYYMPAVPEFVIKVDPEKAIYVRPISGMFDDGEEA